MGTAVCATFVVPLLAVLGTQGPGTQARAAGTSAATAQPRHVVIVGISGLTWNIVTQAATPNLLRLASAGSVGSLVDYAQEPLACSADGWLTLNSAARAQGPRPCTSLPTVTPAGGGAKIPAMPQIIQDNRQFHESPDWGLLGTLASCTTAVGPGAALALRLPADTALLRAVCSGPVPVGAGPLPADRCRPRTDSGIRTGSCLRHRRTSLLDLAAELPPRTLLLVTAPGAAAGTGQGKAPSGPPHLMSVLVNGPGFAGGLLNSTATRRPGVVTLTDLTPTVAAWLGHQVPAGTAGARITRSDRGELDSTVTSLLARDTAEQVWIATHGWFFIGYVAADALAFGLPVLLFWGSAEERRHRRARSWRTAGVAAAAVPLASYLANLAPWWNWIHPAWWLYGMTIGWTRVIAAAALAWPRRRDAPGPFGAIAAATLLLLAVDVMAGSRLQLDAPFGLSLLVSGRFYGIGNDALGVYCVSALVAAAWVARARARVGLGTGREPRADGGLGPSVTLPSPLKVSRPGAWGRLGCLLSSLPGGRASGRRWAGRSRSYRACCCLPRGWPGHGWAGGGR